MKKAILLSIKPEWLEKILNGKKLIEIRKTMPKCNLPIDVYLYCTNTPKYHHLYDLTYVNKDQIFYAVTQHNKYSLVAKGFLNGKVVAKFTLNKIWNFKVDKLNELEKFSYSPYGIEICSIEDITQPLIRGSGLSLKEMYEYSPYKPLYAWHIDNLQIFNKPVELSNFYKYDNSYDNSFGWSFEDKEKYIPLKKAPQSWQYVWVKE